jgi:hypothetical protein
MKTGGSGRFRGNALCTDSQSVASNDPLAGRAVTMLGSGSVPEP